MPKRDPAVARFAQGMIMVLAIFIAAAVVSVMAIATGVFSHHALKLVMP